MLTITEEGGIQPLVELLRTKAASYESPTKALWHLAATEDNQTAHPKKRPSGKLLSESPPPNLR